MAIPKTICDREYEKFKENITDAGTDVRTCDINANITLDAILIALGGMSDTTPTIFNITLGLINTEQSQALPASTKKFLIKSRGNSLLQLAYTATESGTKYVTIPKQGVFVDENFYTSQTIFFQSPQTGDVIEIIAYA